MITTSIEEKLKKKEELEGVGETVDQNPELSSLTGRSPLSELGDVYGEISLPKTPESDVLTEVRRYKEEKQREQKENSVIVPADDQTASTTQTPADDNDDNAVPIKYYGYQIPKKIVEMLGTSSKMNLEKSDDWLKVWLMRLMEKIS